VAIPLNTIKQGCCDVYLNGFSVTNGDELDDKYSTCDKIIECKDKYILVEEKSILLGFFNDCCNFIGKNLDNFKYVDDGIEYLKITELIELIHTIDNLRKEVLLSKSVVNLFSTSSKKISHTTNLLCKQDDTQKTDGIVTFYLYCNSGHPIDGILYAFLSDYKNNIFLECTDLKNKLEEGCQ